MTSENYRSLEDLLKSFNTSALKFNSAGTLMCFLQSNDETLTVAPDWNDPDLFVVSYLASNREVAEKTLKGGTGIIDGWYRTLGALQPITFSISALMGVRTLEQCPDFEVKLRYEEASSLCIYLAGKMNSASVN